MLAAAYRSSRGRRSIEEDPMRHSLALLISSALAVLAAFWFVSAADAAKKKTDKPSVSEITVTKQHDTASPKLFMQKSNAPKIKGETTRQQR
jgi:hypothetical protein